MSNEDTTLFTAEQSVLSAMLMDRVAIARVRKVLEPQNFQGSAHRSIATAMFELHGEGIEVEPLSLSSRLESHGALKAVGGMDYIGYLVDVVPSAANVTHHASIIRAECDRKRAVHHLRTALSQLEKGEVSTREVAQSAQAALLPLAVESDERGFRELTVDHIRDVLAEIHLRGEKSRLGVVPGFATGYASIDRETQGFRPGEFVVIGGVPKSMKTNLVFNVLINAAMRRDFSGVVSAEMTFSALLERVLAAASLVPISSMSRGMITDLEEQRIKREGARLAGHIAIDDESLPELSDVIARSTELKARRPEMKLLVVDYIQLVQHRMGGRRGDEEINGITRALKGLAKRLELVVIAPAQANYKELEQRADKRPELRDFQGASGMAQDADFAALIYNPRLYDPSASPVLELAFRACRRTSPWTAYLPFDPQTLSIIETSKAAA